MDDDRTEFQCRDMTDCHEICLTCDGSSEYNCTSCDLDYYTFDYDPYMDETNTCTKIE